MSKCGLYQGYKVQGWINIQEPKNIICYVKQTKKESNDYPINSGEAFDKFQHSFS